MRLVAAMMVLSAAGAGLLALGSRRGAEASSWPRCDGFDTQPEAQAYWESHGSPAQADGDGDGKVCESLPREKEKDDCRRPRKTITVRLSRARYPESTLHFAVAWKQGAPRRYTIARKLADSNRDAWEPFVPAGCGRRRRRQGRRP